MNHIAFFFFVSKWQFVSNDLVTEWYRQSKNNRSNNDVTNALFSMATKTVYSFFFGRTVAFGVCEWGPDAKTKRPRGERILAAGRLNNGCTTYTTGCCCWNDAAAFTASVASMACRAVVTLSIKCQLNCQLESGRHVDTMSAFFRACLWMREPIPRNEHRTTKTYSVRAVAIVNASGAAYVSSFRWC